MNSTKFSYRCIDCGKEYSTTDVMYLCPSCSKENTTTTPPKGVLKTVYNYSSLRSLGYEGLKKNHFLDVLPVNSIDSFSYLKVGKTPLYPIKKLDKKGLGFNLFLKDDSQNPTFSFKDRASTLVSAFAKENKLDTIIAASTGNAGSSLAGICASQGQQAIIMVPESAPIAKLTQIIMYGAKIVPVKGTYDEAFDLSVKATEEFGWYNRNTAFNPFTIEGKKSVSLELIEQLNFIVPDRIFVPVGDGVIISGVYKGFEDLLNLGIIDRMPIIVAVQSEGSDNLARNIDSKEFKIKPSSTVADSISVDIPRNFYMARDFINTYKGVTLVVSDEEIMQASSILSRNTGIFAEPAATTAFAGMLNYQKNNKLTDNSNNVVLLTGSGLKDLKSVSGLLNMPKSIYPTIENLERMLKI